MSSLDSSESSISIPKAIHNIDCYDSNRESDVNKQISDCSLKFSFFLIGAGYLFPYNSVVTAVDYFAHIYSDSIDFYLGWFLLAPLMPILCITLKFGYWGSIYQRMVGCFLLEGILIIIIPLVDNVYVLFCSTFLLGCLSAILQGTVWCLLGFLGPDFIIVTQTGIGCSGVVVGLIRIITKIFLPNDIEYSTYLYFLLAIIMVMIDVLIYIFVLNPSEKVQRAIAQDAQKNASLYAIKTQKHMTSEVSDSKNLNERQSMINNLMNSNINNYRTINRSPTKKHAKIENENHVVSLSNGTKENDNASLSLWRLFRVTWKCQVAVFLNYIITLSLFPGILSLMKWDDAGDSWFAVIQIFLFNLFDTLGKNLMMVPWILELWTPNVLISAALCRLVFVPLFVMCISPLIFSWQTAIVINGCMGITNGVVGTAGFCLGPLSPKLPVHERGRASQISSSIDNWTSLWCIVSIFNTVRHENYISIKTSTHFYFIYFLDFTLFKERISPYIGHL
eukprot:426062_1